MKLPKVHAPATSRDLIEVCRDGRRELYVVVDVTADGELELRKLWDGLFDG